MAPQDSRYEVDLFWNLEDAMVTNDQANQIARRITNSLRTINKQYYLGKMYAVGSSTLDSIKDISDVLERNGFKMNDRPARRTTCNKSGCSEVVCEKEKADRVILQCMLRHILNDGLNKNMMLISGNPDFKLAVDILKNNGYKIFIAAKWINSTSDYQLSGNHVFEWEEMKVGTTHEILRSVLATSIM